MTTNYRNGKAPNATQQAILNSIPQLSAQDLDAYGQMASPNWLFPQCETPESLSGIKPLDVLPHDLPKECNVDGYGKYRRSNTHGFFGGVPAYSYVIRFTMIRDDDPYGQGIPTGTVGYWTHDGQGCHIDSQNQIHGIRWVGHSSSLAITGEQEWTVDLLLFGANCGWPENWDPFYNGYVNVILNSVWDWNNPPHYYTPSHRSPTMLKFTCGEWRQAGKRNGPMGSVDSWVVTNVMWETVFNKIWPQSVNAKIRPTIQVQDGCMDGNERRALKILARTMISEFSDQIRLRSSLQLKHFDPHASVINRRLI